MCWTFFTMCPHWAVLREKNRTLTILLSSLVFNFFISWKKIIIYYNNIYLSWVFALFLIEHLFCLSHRKTRWTMLVDDVGLKKVVLSGPWILWSLRHLFLSINWSGPGTRSTTNQGFYKALGRLHGPCVPVPHITSIATVVLLCYNYMAATCLHIVKTDFTK
jgi:hypothetical protein